MSRTGSFSSSVSSRAPSASSRNTSNGSFSSSVGPGNRPASYHGSRPQTAMSVKQPSVSRTNLPRTRPATSMEMHSPDHDRPAPKESIGTLQTHDAISPSSHRQHSLQIKKLRGSQSMQSLRSKSSVNNMREISVSTAMSKLSLDEHDQIPHPAMSATMMPPPKRNALVHKHSLQALITRHMRLKNNENSLVVYQGPGDSPAAPVTPSQIPVLSKAEVLASPITPCKSRRDPLGKTPKQSPCFLSKNSNTVGFTAWDVADRLERVESMYTEMKTTLEGTVTERHDLEHEQALLKHKGKRNKPIQKKISVFISSFRGSIQGNS